MQRGNNFGNRMKNILASGAVSCVAAMGASRHNSPLFFISHLPRWLRTRRFSKPLEKHSVSPLFYLFAHLHLLPSDSFSSLIFFLLLFSSLTLPTSAFSSVHFVGSLTSKLPSISQV
jgi:hypothetical protein